MSGQNSPRDRSASASASASASTSTSASASATPPPTTATATATSTSSCATPPLKALAVPSSAVATDGRVPATWQFLVEMLIWGSSFLLFFYLYNGIAELSRMRGVDYTPFIMTRVDTDWLPPMTWLVVPYLLVCALPLVYPYAVWRAHGVDLPRMRRAWFGFAVLFTAGYVLFYLFPVQCASLDRTWTPHPDTNVFDFLYMQFVRKGMTRWGCMPSMHVANSWFQYKVFERQNLPFVRAAKYLAYVQWVATLGVRSHYIVDLPLGFLLSEVALRCVFYPLEDANAFSFADLPPAKVAAGDAAAGSAVNVEVVGSPKTPGLTTQAAPTGSAAAVAVSPADP